MSKLEIIFTIAHKHHTRYLVQKMPEANLVFAAIMLLRKF